MPVPRMRDLQTGVPMFAPHQAPYNTQTQSTIEVGQHSFSLVNDNLLATVYLLKLLRSAAPRLPSRNTNRQWKVAQVWAEVRRLVETRVIHFDNLIRNLTVLYLSWVREEVMQSLAVTNERWVHHQVVAGVLAEDARWLAKGEIRYGIDLVGGVRDRVEGIIDYYMLQLDEYIG